MENHIGTLTHPSELEKLFGNEKNLWLNGVKRGNIYEIIRRTRTHTHVNTRATGAETNVVKTETQKKHTKQNR